MLTLALKSESEGLVWKVETAVSASPRRLSFWCTRKWRIAEALLLKEKNLDNFNQKCLPLLFSIIHTVNPKLSWVTSAFFFFWLYCNNRILSSFLQEAS